MVFSYLITSSHANSLLFRNASLLNRRLSFLVAVPFCVDVNEEEMLILSASSSEGAVKSSFTPSNLI